MDPKQINMRKNRRKYPEVPETTNDFNKRLTHMILECRIVNTKIGPKSFQSVSSAGITDI